MLHSQTSEIRLSSGQTIRIFRDEYLLQIGYWRYISIYRHLQRNPDNQLYPLFEYFENWCQDENRHGDFVAALLKSQPQVSFLLAFSIAYILLTARQIPYTISIDRGVGDFSRVRSRSSCWTSVNRAVRFAPIIPGIDLQLAVAPALGVSKRLHTFLCGSLAMTCLRDNLNCELTLS